MPASQAASIIDSNIELLAWNKLVMMSPDTAIAIVFGLIGTLISFVGIAIACLTLRFMMRDKHEKAEREAHDPILRYEHTHLFPMLQGQRLRERKPRIVSSALNYFRVCTGQLRPDRTAGIRCVFVPLVAYEHKNGVGLATWRGCHILISTKPKFDSIPALQVSATLPTLLAAVAFCPTDDLRYGCALKEYPPRFCPKSPRWKPSKWWNMSCAASLADHSMDLDKGD
ncbi:hypothetical protein V8E51_014025 [Hyaloscypha variabilis]